MRAWLIAVVLLMFVTAGTAFGSTDPYRDQAETIPCPVPPAGWTNPAESDGGRVILTPLTPVSSALDPTLEFGAPIVQLDCLYKTASSKILNMYVRYALPIDLNPWNDFYVGCTSTHRPQPIATRAKAWNGRDRVYRVVGANTWSLATFIDDLGQIEPNQVKRFEAMARAMLAAAQPFAHNCKLAGNGAPVDLKSIWTFSFDAKTTSAGVTSSASDSGSFDTTANPYGGNVGAISNLVAADFRLTIKGKRKAESVGLRVGAPIEFRHSYGSLLRIQLRVTASNDASCRTGSAGTLLVSLQQLTPPQVVVQVCGHTYLHGTGSVRARIQTV